MGFWDLFSRKRRDFYRMLLDQTEKTLEGSESLEIYMVSCDAAIGRQIVEIEREADDLRRILIDELNRTFITPFDREDIFSLSRAVDDIVDSAKTTVEEMRLFELKSNDFLRRMSGLLRKGALEIRDAMKHMRKHPSVAMAHAMEAKRAENQMNHLYHEALVDLFHGSDVVHMLKMREIYRHLNRSADRGDEAANVITNIIVKLT